MMLFQSEGDVEDWCRETGEPRGEVLTLPRVWALAQAWYGDRMAPDFRGRTAEQAVKIFLDQGLTSDFWRL